MYDMTLLEENFSFFFKKHVLKKISFSLKKIYEIQVIKKTYDVSEKLS